MSFTNYLENAVMDHVFGAGTFAKPGRHVALFTGAPGEAGGGTEVSGTNYARIAASFTVSGSAPTQATTALALEYATAGSAWGTVTHAAVFDAATGGNMLAFATLAEAKPISSGDVFRIPASNLTFTLE